MSDYQIPETILAIATFLMFLIVAATIITPIAFLLITLYHALS